MPKIKAAVGIRTINNFKAWETNRAARAKTVLLDGDATFEDVGSIFARIARDLKIPDDSAADSILETIVARGKFPDGAILFIGDDTRGAQRIVLTGCCFGGIAAWRDLFDILDQKPIWLGHSPTPEVEYSASNTIKIWADGERKPSENFFLEFTKSEFRKRLSDLQTDLIDFTALIELWAEQRTNRTQAEQTTRKFGFAPG